MAASASIAALLRRNSSLKTFSSPTSKKICSPQFKEVLLHDWWLIKADSDVHGKRLAIGGFTWKESQGTRGFISSPITKRHDAVTLQTADGITVTVCGNLNLSRSLSNGFPLKVCNDFVFGFPYYWEEFTALSFDGLETTPENSEHVPLDAFSVTILHDLFKDTSLAETSTNVKRGPITRSKCQSTSAGTSSNDGELGSKKESPSNIKRTVTTPAKISLNHTKSKTQRKRKGSKDTTIAETSTNVKRRLKEENSVVVDIGALTSGPITRRRSRA